MGKAWNSIKHLFGHKWKREWAAELHWQAPDDSYGARNHFVWTERCEVCGEVRAWYKDFMDRSNYVDMDRLICSAKKGLIPYEVGTHKYLHS